MEERIAAKNSNYVCWWVSRSDCSDIMYHVLFRDSRTSSGVYEENFFPSVSRIELVAINDGKWMLILVCP